jgi:hypothetical protein
MTPRKPSQSCVRCGEEIEWILSFGANPFELCRRCLGDSFSCPRCNRYVPKAESRGSYCKQCRSDYNRAYAARRRGVSQ